MTMDFELTVAPGPPLHDNLDAMEIDEHSMGPLLGSLLGLVKDDDTTLSTECASDFFDESDASSAASHSSLSSPTRAVRFDLAATVRHENHLVCREDVYRLWYDCFDYESFKRETHVLARQMANVERRNRAPHSYERAMTRAFDLCAEQLLESAAASGCLPAEDRRHLNHWAAATPCRLGLDKWALPELRLERARRKAGLMGAVLDLQAAASAAGLHPLGRKGLADRLRAASEALSLAPRLFALHMAQSLAHAQAHAAAEA